MSKNKIEQKIRSLFKDWVAAKEQEGGLNKIRYAGPKFGAEEYDAMLSAVFDDWWSGGKYTVQTEDKLSKSGERNHSLLTNSGSSANLILMSAAKDLYFNDGDKILTLSCGFPTTVNPIIQNRLVPVFADINLDTLNIDVETVERAVKKDPKIKGLFVAHTLGFYPDIDAILDVGRKYNLQVLFDNCDAYGTYYKQRPIQSYGKAATYSFYVAHHLSMGEGGGVSTNDVDLHYAMRSYRNWGRYCSSPICCIRSIEPNAFCSGIKLTKDSDLPQDYGVNYQFEYLGYNLKPLELQAAILGVQLDKLHDFTNIRRNNYTVLKNHFNGIKSVEFKTWELPEGVSPFAFPILLPEDARFQRKHLVDFMKRNGIETRMLFGGNLTKHPAYQKNKSYWEMLDAAHPNADAILNRFVMFGVSPVTDETHMNIIGEKLDEFLSQWNY
jgi:CDP-4-dehydro-6-deoxyglucose reductase, E1